MFEYSNTIRELKRRTGKTVSVILSVAMLVTALPADLLGGIASAKAAGSELVLNAADLNGSVTESSKLGDTIYSAALASGAEIVLQSADAAVDVDGMNFSKELLLKQGTDITFTAEKEGTLSVYAAPGKEGTSVNPQDTQGGNDNPGGNATQGGNDNPGGGDTPDVPGVETQPGGDVEGPKPIVTETTFTLSEVPALEDGVIIKDEKGNIVVDSNYVDGDFTITPKVKFDDDGGKDVNGKEYTVRIKLSGSGSKSGDAEITNHIMFSVGKASTVEIVAVSGKSTDATRTLVVNKWSSATEFEEYKKEQTDAFRVTQETADGKIEVINAKNNVALGTEGLKARIYAMDLEEGDYSITSGKSGINILGITVTPSESTPVSVSAACEWNVESMAVSADIGHDAIMTSSGITIAPDDRADKTSKVVELKNDDGAYTLQDFEGRTYTRQLALTGKCRDKGNYLKFTTEGPATMKLVASSGSATEERTFEIRKGVSDSTNAATPCTITSVLVNGVETECTENKIKVKGLVDGVNTKLPVFTVELPEAGTYFVCMDGRLDYYYLSVTPDSSLSLKKSGEDAVVKSVKAAGKYTFDVEAGEYTLSVPEGMVAVYRAELAYDEATHGGGDTNHGGDTNPGEDTNHGGDTNPGEDTNHGGDIGPTGPGSDTGHGNDRPGFWIEFRDGDTYTYTGSAIKPAVNVYYNNELMTEGTDYKLGYKNNSKASHNTDGSVVSGLNAKKYPTVTVTGKGVLAGKKEATFKIVPKSLDNNDVGVNSTLDVMTYTDGNYYVETSKKAAPLLYYGIKKLTNKDFTIEGVSGKVSESNNNTEIKVKGKGNFTGEVTLTLKVVPKKSLEKLKVGKFNNKFTYNGGEQFPDLKTFVTTKKKGALVEGENYFVVKPANLTDAGTVKFVVVGMGEGVTGAVTKSYKISPNKNANVTVTYDKTEEHVYKSTGVTFNSKIIVEADGVELRAGKDYKIAYKNNKKVGNRASFTVNLVGNYKGVKALKNNTFTIVAADINDGDLNIVAGDMTYGKPKAYKPKVLVELDDVLLKTSCYNVEYSIDGNTYAKKPAKLSLSGDVQEQECYVRITGKGNYKGEATVTYTVSKAASGDLDLSKAKITPEYKKTGYTGSVLQPEVTVTVKVKGKGNVTVDKSAYRVEYVNDLKKGKASIVVIGNGNGSGAVGSKVATYSITAWNLTKDTPEGGFHLGEVMKSGTDILELLRQLAG